MNERGTVAALGQEIAEAAQECCRTTLSLNNQSNFIQYYKQKYPDIDLLARTNPHAVEWSNFLNNQVVFHNYVILSGRQIKPSKFDEYAPNSLIQYESSGQKYVGKVAFIASHYQPMNDQDLLREFLFGVRWLKRASFQEFNTSTWDRLYLTIALIYVFSAEN
ncbi:hypothetical protein PHLCEN_2v7996 [Hermanssonia centrifuga]|uniref:Uncharacterized protein n=1 Tax=Hermanssonia centrifuga TaxID=98765 RepID=A0A2R6NUX2_9APHY|nr:hypothetical protein PHLCEN_2v7996 [Hermanssonia centrifuga]